MKLIYLILFALLIVATFVGVIYLSVKTLPNKKKVGIIAFAVLSLLVTEVLLLSTPSLPDKANNLITHELTQVEHLLNSTKAGFTDQVLDPCSLQLVLSNSEELLSKANSDSPAGWIVQLIGARKFTKMLEAVVKDTDGHLSHFQTTGTPITIHNIFVYTQQQVQTPILKTTRVLQILVLVLALALLVVCVIVYFLIRNDAMSDPQIIMGENKDTTNDIP